MPRLNLNFVVGLGVTIIILLGSIQPRHFNTKIYKLHSLYLVLQDLKQGMLHKIFLKTIVEDQLPSSQGSKKLYITKLQMLLNFVMESQLCLHMLVGRTTMFVDGQLARLYKTCILHCIGFYSPWNDLLTPIVTTLNYFPLLPRSHNLQISQTRQKRGKQNP